MSHHRKQHFVSQGYLKQWLDSSGLLYQCKKNDITKVESKNADDILWEPNKYTIYGGMLCASKEDLEYIFEPVKGLIVEYKGKILKDVSDLNIAFEDIDNWEIRDNNGSLRSNKKIKNKIENHRSLKIEENWQKIENSWPELYEKIFSFINKKKQRWLMHLKEKESFDL